MNNKTISALDAQFEAQKIAFAPVIFQVTRTMKQLGILTILDEHNDGLTIEEISEKKGLKPYGVQVLLETALSAKIVTQENDKYILTKIGFFLENDEMIDINFNFNHFVNYKGLYDLDKSIQEEKPIGLQVFGDWDTIYPNLAKLPSDVKNAWFSFDHYYSDLAFKETINKLKEYKPKTILDVGGNTGRFAIDYAKQSNDTKITILDLPEQVDMAKKNIKDNNLTDRVFFHPLDILDNDSIIPNGFDIVWMSQFIDCFSKDDAIKILTKVRKSLSPNSRLYILESLWDKQKFEASSYAIINTSPYFTAMANGCSKMFNSTDLFDYLKKAGLEIEETIDNLGLSQTLVKCKAQFSG